MIVPQYWAEGRILHRKQGKQVTMRRFGWSDESPEAAQAMADQRTKDALERFLSGEKIRRYEPKIPYNGAEGVPIREQIIDRKGETILTRNSYGALCLNSPDVLFVDIDHGDNKVLPHLGTALFALLIGIGLCFRFSENSPEILPIIFLIAALILPTTIPGLVRRAVLKAKGGEKTIAMQRISKWLEKHPDWNLRIYRTPAGLRLLATHRKFSPSDPEVAACFEAFGSDKLYRLMCFRQNCFRARVSPKPWRIGIPDHLRPRPGTWPVKAEHIPAREKWISRYETTSKDFAACSFVESQGSGTVQAELLPIVKWHDELCSAVSALPIA